jgi:DNA-binding transcriptional regulator GbsR (MarR family)
MPAINDPIREQFINKVGEFVGELGLSRSVGQLYALLYMSPRPVCLEDMAEACGMSKASASLNIRELERWGAVRRVWVPGDRKDYYEANRAIPEIVINRLKEGLGRRLDNLERAVLEASSQVQRMNEDPETRKFYAERLREIQELHGSLRRIMNNMDKLYQLTRRFI